MKPTDKLNRRLTAVDAAFIYGETNETPMHIGGVEILEGKLSYESLYRELDGKLHLVPRYQQILVPAPLGLGHPTWESDPNFDLANHIETVSMARPGSDRQFRATRGSLFEGKLDRSRHLWKLVIVEGREDGNTGLIWIIHHAMVDGVSGAELLQIVLSTDPNATPEAPIPRESAELPGKRSLVIDAVTDTVRETANSGTVLRKKVRSLARGKRNEGHSGRLGEISSLMLDAIRPISKLPFNTRTFSGKRELAWSHASFAEIRGIRNSCGGTVNDLILSVLAGGMYKYLCATGVSAKGKTLRTACPVSLRSSDDQTTLRNQVSIMPLDIRLDETNPVTRLENVSKRTALLKDARIPQRLDLGTQIWSGVHPATQKAVLRAGTSRTLSRIMDTVAPRPMAHMICTNIPGPQITLYAAGRQVLHHYPMLPVAPGMGLNMAVFSYNQRVYFGYIGDRAAVADIEFFQQYVDQAFIELREAAGVAIIPFVELKSKSKTDSLESSKHDPVKCTMPEGSPGTSIDFSELLKREIA